MIYDTTTPGVYATTRGYRKGFASIVPEYDTPPDKHSDIFRIKIRESDNVAILRWEAPAHMADEYKLPWLGSAQTPDTIS